MPYCLACGEKTDFEATDCPACGQPISRRVDPAAGDGSTAEMDWDAPDEGAAADVTTGTVRASEGDEGERQRGNGTGDATAAADEPPLAAVDEMVAADDRSATDDAPSRTAGLASPETVPEGESPFAGRWSLAFAAGYPIDDDYRPLLVGGLLELFAFVIPVFTLFTAGYGFRLCRAVARGQQARPAFEDYGQLLLDGMKFSLVVVCYLGFALVGGIGAVLVGTVDEPFGIALWIAVGVLTVYPLPASLTACGATDEFRAAFSRTHAGQLATSWTYLKGWVAWLVAVAAVAVVGVVSLVTLVGPVVVRAWGIYSLGALWGYYYREAAAKGVVPPAPDEPVR